MFVVSRAPPFPLPAPDTVSTTEISVCSMMKMVEVVMSMMTTTVTSTTTTLVHMYQQ